MRFYLSSPQNQLQADALRDQDVLLSFALYDKWMDRYQQAFRRVLIDSGAFSEMNGGRPPVDVLDYRDWSQRWMDRADAIAGLDSIQGKWRVSLANYEKIPWSFPTFHDTDPPELLDDLVPMAQERPGKWLAIGLAPPRQGKDAFVRETLDRIPSDIHLHGFAMRLYSEFGRWDSMDSTNWLLDAWKYREAFPWLTLGETIDIVVKRYQRENRGILATKETDQLTLDGTT